MIDLQEDLSKRLYILMNVAAEHQQAVQAALEDLRVERAAMVSERATLTQAVANVSGVADHVKRTAAQTISAIQKAAGEAINASVKESFIGVSETAAAALETAAKPILNTLSGVVSSAHDVEGQLKNASAWFAWKWVALFAGGCGGLLLMTYLVFQGLVWWQNATVRDLATQKAALQEDVAELQAAANATAKRTGGLRLINASDGLYLIVPNGIKRLECKVGPCLRLR